MSQSPRVPAEQFVESVREEVDEFLAQIVEAVNEAPDGEWISGSEEQVREITGAMRQRIFQRAVQERVDAAEAAFPPSAPSDHRQATGE